MAPLHLFQVWKLDKVEGEKGWRSFITSCLHNHTLDSVLVLDRSVAFVEVLAFRDLVQESALRSAVHALAGKVKLSRVQSTFQAIQLQNILPYIVQLILISTHHHRRQNPEAPLTL